MDRLNVEKCMQQSIIGVKRKKESVKQKATREEGEMTLDREDGQKRKRVCIRDCSVVLERLMFKEIMVTAPSPDKREVFYVSTYDDLTEEDFESSTTSYGDDRYEDWRLQTIDAFDCRNFQMKKKKRRGKKRVSTPKKSMEATAAAAPREQEPALKLFVRVPESQEYVFRVKHASGDLHDILSILSGEWMESAILDAYLLLQLELYWKKIDEDATSTKKEREYEYKSERKRLMASLKPITKPSPKPPINYQYLSYLFAPVKDRDQPVSTFKVNMDFFPELETDVMKSCHLIAPQWAKNHLYLGVFNFPKKEVQIYDSSWHFLPMRLRMNQLKVILKAFDENWIEWNFDIVRRCSQQFDAASCGYYVIYFVETLLKGTSVQRNYRKLPVKTVTEIRKCVAKQLLKTTTLGRKFLEAIS